MCVIVGPIDIWLGDGYVRHVQHNGRSREPRSKRFATAPAFIQKGAGMGVETRLDRSSSSHWFERRKCSLRSLLEALHSYVPIK